MPDSSPGFPHGPSIKWPKVYEALRRIGMDKSKAAAISNAHYNKYRRWGRAGAAGPRSATEYKEQRGRKARRSRGIPLPKSRQKQLVKHYGPVHPGTGSDQGVHGGLDYIRRDQGEARRGFAGDPAILYIEGDSTGKTLGDHGIMIRDQLPSTLYHVTTRADVVLASGALRTSLAGGLGGSSADQKSVSFTVDRNIATQLEHDIKEAARLYDQFYEQMPPIDWDSEVSAWVGGEERAVWGKQLVTTLEQRAVSESWAWDPQPADIQLQTYGVKDWLNQYHVSRERAGFGENPLFFGRDEDMLSIDPDQVRVLEVSRQNIPEDALITDFDLGKPYGLQEVRVWGDIRLSITKHYGPGPHPGTGTSQSIHSSRIHRTSDPEEAVRLLAEGKRVDLDQPREVSTLLDRIVTYVAEAKQNGNTANLNLCHVTIRGTNLFCVGNVGRLRVEMPQFDGTPEPGSIAERYLDPKSGNADVGPLFVDTLRLEGVEVVDGQEFASYLRASQKELMADKVAGMADSYEAGEWDPTFKPIFVTRDNYIMDGHHRWAAVIGVDLADNRAGDLVMNIVRIDLPILEALAKADQFVSRVGIMPQAGFNTGGLNAGAFTTEGTLVGMAKLLKHYGPGPHPGTMTEQSVHGRSGTVADAPIDLATVETKYAQLRSDPSSAPKVRDWALRQLTEGRDLLSAYVYSEGVTSEEKALEARLGSWVHRLNNLYYTAHNMGASPEAIGTVISQPRVPTDLAAPSKLERAIGRASQGDFAAARALRERLFGLTKHAGPIHPGTGTDQSVHGSGGGGKKVIRWHLTDNPKFALDPDYDPPENALSIFGDDEREGIYLTDSPEHWVNAYGYVRPFIAEIELDEAALSLATTPGSSQGFLPAEAFASAKIKRVIPLDEYVREHYGLYGWIESDLDDVRDIGNIRTFPDYKYTGPDVRDLSPEEVERHRQRAREAWSLRGWGTMEEAQDLFKHAAPIHPGTGTDQSVHGGGGGVKYEEFDLFQSNYPTKFVSPDDPSIDFYDLGGVNLAARDLPTTLASRAAILNSSGVESWWSSYDGVEQIRSAAAQFTSEDPWPGNPDAFGMAEEAPVEIGFSEELDDAIAVHVSPTQIAYAYLESMHNQEWDNAFYGVTPVRTKDALFRGISINTPEVEQFYDELSRMEVGDELEWGLASFSPDQVTATSFASDEQGGGFLLQVKPGAKALATSDSSFEMITGGRFRITRMALDRGPWPTVELEQIGTFDPDTGEVS